MPYYAAIDDRTQEPKLMRFDRLKQLADIKPPLTQPEKQKKVGRNDPCPCGCGKKYKRCCGK